MDHILVNSCHTLVNSFCSISGHFTHVPINLIYLSIFALGQNIALKLMATWFYLSTYVLLLTCHHSNCSIQAAQYSEQLPSNILI